MWKPLVILLTAFLAATPTEASSPFDHQHSAWQELVQEHVDWLEGGVASQVDYPGFIADQHKLDAYLASLSTVALMDYEQWSKDQQLAFLINAYNAFTVALVVRHRPVKSIRDIGGLFRNPWKMRFFTLLGGKHHLDWIEHEVIRKPGSFNEPRIHFAVNCAAVGCPALRPEAYVAEHLDSQLADQTHRFLADKSRNRVEGEVLKLSSIFKWYRADFERGWQGVDSLAEFLAPHAQTLDISSLKKNQQSFKQLEIQFLDYDWRLNASR